MKGLSFMMGAMSEWNYGRDPVEPLRFEVCSANPPIHPRHSPPVLPVTPRHSPSPKHSLTSCPVTASARRCHSSSPTPSRSQAALAELKAEVAASGGDVFVNLIKDYVLKNQHRATVTLVPEPTLAEKLEADEVRRESHFQPPLPSCPFLPTPSFLPFPSCPFLPAPSSLPLPSCPFFPAPFPTPPSSSPPRLPAFTAFKPTP